MAKTKFTISLLGFDDRSAEALGEATRRTMKIVDPVNQDDTQVVVVDVDGPDGIKVWEEFRQQWPSKPAVIISEEDPDISQTSFAAKPFTVETLIDKITEAIILAPAAEEIEEVANESVPKEEKTQTAETNQEPAVEETADEAENETIHAPKLKELTPGEKLTPDEHENISDEPEPDKKMPPLSQIAGILSSHSSSSSEAANRKLDTPNPDESYFDPDAHIIGLVLEGIEKGRENGAIAKMACLLDRAIYIDAKNKLVRSNLKDIHMRQIAIAPLGKGENGLDTQLEMIESTTLEELAGSDGSTYPMDTFVWELAVLTSKGRAPAGTPMDEPTYLMQWPNFTRLLPIPNAMKVAAYWLRLPSSLHDLSDNLDIPLRDILSLYSAASLTGLAGAARRKSDKILRPGRPEKHEKRNLFRTIMNNLKKN